MGFPLVQEFKKFTDSQTDRCSFICQWLENNGIPFSIIAIEKSRHIYVTFNSSAYNPLFKIKTILTHYDRTENTPGANDNSAAVFQLLQFAKQLYFSEVQHNIRIFFTDGEEFGDENGIIDQGAYGIASKFKQLGILYDDIYVFDCCGRGDVIVISTAGQTVKGNRNFLKRFDDLFVRTKKLAQIASPQSWITLPVPYSDNAAFIASGIPAVAITILPHEESTKFMLDLRRDKNFEAQLLQSAKSCKYRLPLTWQIMHTENDNFSSLNEEAFILMEKFLAALARSKTTQ
ncbi:MAG: M28 family peptidase [Treponemataceae bacterium]